MVSFGLRTLPCWFVFHLFLRLHQPLIDGELQLVHIVVLVCFFFFIFSSSTPAINRWGALAHAHSCVGSFFILFFIPYQLSIDGELWLACIAVLVCFSFISSSLPAINRWGALACMHSCVGTFFYCLLHPPPAVDRWGASAHMQLCWFFFFLFFHLLHQLLTDGELWLTHTAVLVHFLLSSSSPTSHQ